RLRQPMLQAIYLEGGHEGGDALLLVLDHFVADGMSQAVLVSDLRRLLEHVTGGAPALPPVTSFERWARRLAGHISSAEVEREIGDYWQRLPWHRVRPLPLDFPDGVGVDPATGRAVFGVKASERTVTEMLDVEETERWIARTRGRTYDADDLVLTAVLVALAELTGSPVQFVM